MSERTAGSSRLVERWSPPKVEGTHLGRRPERPAGPTAASAAQQAEAAGYAAGLARAQAEVQARLAELAARIERFDTLVRQLANPLRLLDAQIEEALLTVALSIGSQLARRALHDDSGQIIALVRDCLKQLPLGTREVRVRLHPQDASVMREALSPAGGDAAWQLVEDPTVTRGGCLVESEHSRLDARFESRLNGLVASALGDERTAERGGRASTAGADSAP